jgi:hypothetical protein
MPDGWKINAKGFPRFGKRVTDRFRVSETVISRMKDGIPLNHHKISHILDLLWTNSLRNNMPSEGENT